MQDDKPISLEELLAKQARRNLAVIEAIEGDNENVTLTPWSARSGCLCHLAMRVPKKAVKELVVTDEKHECCGKTLNVVEVLFSEQESIPVKDLFEQLSTSAALYARRRNARGAYRRRDRPQFFRRIPQMLTGDFDEYAGGGGMGLAESWDCYADCLADCYVDVSLAVPPGPERNRRLRLCRQSCHEECFNPDYWA